MISKKIVLFFICICGYDEVFAGSISRRIFGGTRASEGEYPYVTLFSLKMTSHKLVVPLCGGAIVNENHILTASHCLEPTKEADARFMIMVGSKYSRSEEAWWYYIRKMYLTENQKQFGPPVDDLALIRIWGKFVFGKNIQPVKLSATKNVPLYTSAVVTGWGQYIQKPYQESSAYLLAVNMTVIPNSECESIWDRYDTEHNICVQSPGDTGTCNGDSGGPLVINNTLYGLLSYGHSDCGNGVPEVYVNVGSFYNWIQEKLSE